MEGFNIVRNWRELLTVFAVAVIGVAAVLALAAAIDSMETTNRAKAAAARVEMEAKENMFFLGERALIARCVGASLDGLEAKLLADKTGWTPLAPVATQGPLAGSVLPIPLRRWSNAAWTDSLAAGDVAHMNDRDRLLYVRLYQQIDRAGRLNEAEYDAVARLNVLTKPVVLTPEATLEMLQLVEAERARNRTFSLEAFQAFRAWTASGRDTKTLVQEIRLKSPIAKACTPPKKAGALPNAKDDGFTVNPGQP